MNNITPLFKPVPQQQNADFEAFWAVYPRRKDKLDALRAWKRALHYAEPHIIVAAAMKYAQTADPNYTKLPATWLNKGSFLDEDDKLPQAVDPIESALRTKASMVSKANSGNKFCADWVKNNVTEQDMSALRERGLV